MLLFIVLVKGVLIERELGWRPQEDLSSGLQRTVRWYLDHQAWVEEIRNYRGERLG